MVFGGPIAVVAVQVGSDLSGSYRAMAPERIAVARRSRGRRPENDLERDPRRVGYEVVDLGTDGPDSVDYPDFADKLAGALAGWYGGAGRPGMRYRDRHLDRREPP